MAWFVVQDAFGEVLELTPCSDIECEQVRRMNRAVHTWEERGDKAKQLHSLSYRMTSFDGNVRVLSIVQHRPSFHRDGFLRAAALQRRPG